MKYIYSRSEGAGIGHGLLKRWVGCVLGVVVFLSAAGSVALAENVMTQHQYILWMANVTGDNLPAGATGDDLTTWARGKGMNPTGGWQLNAKLSKQVMAQTLVQLLNLAPRKGTFDAVRILEREGIVIQSGADGIRIKDFVAAVDSGFLVSAKPGNGYGDDKHIHTGPPGREDDDSPTPTRPNGNGPDGEGPPGWTGIKPGNGQGNGPRGH